MPASGREYLLVSGADYKGAQAVNMRLQQITGTSDFNNLVDGLFAFNSSTKRLQFVDTAVGGSLVNVPRIDSGQSETVQAAWTFSRGAATPPFIAAATLPSVGSTATMVTNLNAHYLSGYLADAAANVSTIVLRDGSGRAKVAYPSATDDAANKQYVDDTLSGLTNVYAACRVVAVANVNVSSAPSSIDSVTLSNGDRVLLTGQTTGSQNGLYVFNGGGAAMTRTTDADSSGEMLTGSQTFIREGSLYAGSSWRLITPQPITLGTTSLTFTQISAAVQMDAGPGLGKNGNEIYVKLGTAGSPAGRSYTQGGILYADSASTLNQTGALTGILIGNGSSVPSAVTGTANTVAKFGAAGATLANSQITDNGTVVTLGGTVNVSGLTANRFVTTDGSKNLQSFDLFGTGNTWTALQTFSPGAGKALHCNDNSSYSILHLVTLGRSATGYGTIGDGFRSTTSAGVYHYDRSDFATQIDFSSGKIRLNVAAAGTAGSAITFTKALEIANNGAVNLPLLTASRFVKTDASSNLTTAQYVALGGDVSGTLPVANGGTGTSTSFTAGSVVFAGSAGVYSQDNANLLWDNTNKRLGIGTTVPKASLQVGVGQSDTGTQTVRIGATAVASTVVTALHIDANPASFDMGVSVVFGQRSVTYGEYTSRIVHFANAANDLSSKLQLQTHSITQNVWNTGLMIDHEGKLGVNTTSPNSLLDVRRDAIGVSQSDVYGMTLSNTTAAAAGAQQYSPALKWTGRGWKTNATAASQAVDFRAYVVPVQGAAAPTGYLTFEAAINGGSYAEVLRADSAGALFIQGTKKVPVSYTANLGTSATSYVVTHNLGTNSVIVFIRNTSTGQCGVAGYATTTTNSVTVYFDTAPTAGLYDVIIIAVS